jgi:hypothetical protein
VGEEAKHVKEGLIDEFQLFINPGAIAKAFDCGIVVLNYEPKRG